MDPFHKHVAKLALTVLEEYGFVLAGGYAFHLHEVTDRLSRDVDLFTDRFDAAVFDHAEQAVVDACRRHGLHATVGLSLDVFRQIIVTDPTAGTEAVLDLGFDARDRPPARFEVGPVLSLEDAAVSKIRTLVDREAARDYLDVHDLLAGGHFTAARLVDLARQADPNVTKDVVATALERSRLPEDEDYLAYGVTASSLEQLHADLASAAASLRRHCRR